MAEFNNILIDSNKKKYSVSNAVSKGHLNPDLGLNIPYENIDYNENPSNETPKENNKKIIKVEDMPNYENVDIIKNIDSQISDIESQITSLDEEIKKKKKELEKEGPDVFEKIWKTIFFQDIELTDRAQLLKQEIADLEAEKAVLENQKMELEVSRDCLIDTFKTVFYKEIVKNYDFKEQSQNHLTTEEARAILNLMNALTSHGLNDFLNEKYLKDYDAFVQLLKDQGLYDQYTNPNNPAYIDLDMLKSALSKDFNYFNLGELCKEQSAGILIYIDKFSSEDFWVYESVMLIDYMTDEEKAICNYLYNTGGTKDAENFFRFIEDELNRRKGEDAAKKFINEIDVNDPNVGDYIDTHIKGLIDGSENFAEGIINTVVMDGKLSANQYEVLYIYKYLQENKGLTIDYEISSSIGNMIPPAVIGMLTSPKVGNALMMVSVYGNTAEKSLQEGHEWGESIGYGLLSALSEGCLGYFLGSIKGLSKLESNFFLSLIKEGGEEAVQAAIDPYIRNIALGTNESIDWDEVLKSGIYGIISAGYINGGSIVVNGLTIEINDIMIENIDTIAQAEDLGIEVDYTKINDLQYIKDLEVKLDESNDQNVTQHPFRDPYYKLEIDYSNVPEHFRDGYKEIMQPLIDNFNNSYKIDKNVAAILEDIYTNSGDDAIGIHCTGMSNINSILENGLWLTGDTSHGVVSNSDSIPVLYNNILFDEAKNGGETGFMTFCQRIGTSVNYKNATNEGYAVIVKVPESSIDDASAITYYDGTQYVVKSEYIVGYVKTSVDSNGVITFQEFIYNDKYVQQ